MTTKKLPSAYVADLCVFIGRFQPFHNGHLAVVRQALEKGRFLLILLGSAGDPRRPDYIPFTAEERERMIRACLTPEENARVFCVPLEDSAYNLNDWVKSVQFAVMDVLDDLALRHQEDIDPEAARVALIGHSKDNSSYYLKLFPQWEAINVPNHNGLSATPFRLRYFSEDAVEQERALVEADGYLPDPVLDFLWKFRMTTDAYNEMVEELAFATKYKQAWAAAPYPPTFVTTDAVVVQAGHILLIQRKARPGKGLWALPGGFLNQDERVLDGIIRELKEETSIKVPVPVIKGSMVGDIKLFDHPHRSSRGRTITHAALFHLEGQTELPKIRAADDAADARWFPLAEVRRDMMFEDHWGIIQNLVSRL